MKKILKTISYSLISLLIVLFLSAAGLYFYAAKNLPSIKKITDYNPPLTTTVYSKNGTILGQFYKEKRFLRTLDQMSSCLPQAFISAEDGDFYQHEGLDFLSIVRAAIANFKAGHIVQGGSTITQQVIDNLLLKPGRSYIRKLREAILAYRLDHNLNKNEILTIYLNHIYLGAGSYGVEAAARTYFGKHASDLNIQEAALLAGLPKAPSLYNPYKNPQAAKSRQRYVLKRMYHLGKISQEQYHQAITAPLHYQPMEDPSWKRGPYFLEAVRQKLIQEYGKQEVYTRGLNVYTTIDLRHQKFAKQAIQKGLESLSKRRGWLGPIDHLELKEFEGLPSWKERDLLSLNKGEWVRVLITEVHKDGALARFGNQTASIDVKTMAWARQPNPQQAPENVPGINDAHNVLKKGDLVYASVVSRPENKDGLWDLALEQKPKVEGALVSIDPANGAVRSLVGGYDFSRSQFNRAIQARRQPGSVFKPIVYSAALDHGYTPASTILDAPVVLPGQSSGSVWRPQNYSRTVRGKTLLRTGLVHSINLVTIRLAQAIGIEKIIHRAKDLAIEADFPHNLTISIGTLSVSLMDMCQAYSAFARDGTIIEPYLIERVTDPWKREIYETEPKVKKSISPQNSYIMTNLLKQVVNEGTGWRVKALGRPVAGKTGTTNNQRDAWFIGYTPYLLTGVYVGFDNPKSMGRYETGSRAASPIWLSYRKEVESQYPVQDFQKPRGIVMARIDAQTGLLAGPSTEKCYFLPFKAGTQPIKMAKAETGPENKLQSGYRYEELLKELF